jgi:hypothetical protein
MTEAPSFEFDVISEDDGFWLDKGNDEGEGSLDRFGFGFGVEHGLGAIELVLIDLDMFVSHRGRTFHVPPCGLAACA